MITLYDLGGKAPLKCWSLNSWKARYALNMKKLPYRTIYVEIHDVSRVIKEAGFPPSRFKEDGTPKYTVPSIFDDSTGAAITDSYKIAEYLDKQYPETPRAFPSGTEALQAVFYRHFNDHIGNIALLIIPSMPNVLNEGSFEYFYSTRKVVFGKPVDHTRPVGKELEKTWKGLNEILDELEGWYGKSSGRFLVGDEASFGDFTVAGMVAAVKIVCGEESEDWQRLKAMNKGRWMKLLSDLELYASVEN